MPSEIIEIKGCGEVQAKNKLKNTGASEGKQVCCLLLKKIKPDIKKYTQKLIKAQNDSAKFNWAWSIINATGRITELKSFKKEKSSLCPKCKFYLEPRRRLAELVIQGCRWGQG